MTDLFLKVLEMSIVGSVVVLATILFRFLLRKRSKRFIMILWAVVAVRLLLPINIQSVISIFNYIPLHTDAITTQIQEAMVFEETNADASIDDAVSEKTNSVAAVHETSGEHHEVNVTAVHNEHARAIPDVKVMMAIVWFIGFAAVALYTVIRFVLLKIKLKNAVRIDKNVYESDKVKSPFVFGLFVPKIYLPEVLDNNEREYILMHEKNHIRHGDWIGKLIGTLIVSVHWFNPFVWISFALFEQDIEMSCDESTVSKMTSDLKQAYAISIVNYAKMSNNRKYLVTPLGFSNSRFCKVEVTHRVKNIISYKKGTKFTSVLIVAALLFVAATLGLNSKTLSADELFTGDVSVQRNAPFNFTARRPEIKALSDTEKEILFNRNGKTINGKIKLPEGDGPFKTIVICKAIDSQSNAMDTGYEKMADYFNKNGLAVVLFDTNTPLDEYYSPEHYGNLTFEYVLDLYAVLDELKFVPDVNVEKVYLWGHHAGGTVASYAGTDRQDDVKGVILVEPELGEYTFSEEPRLTVNSYDSMKDCKVPVTVIWGTLLPSTRPAEKAVENLPYGKMVILDGNSYGRSFDDEYARQAAEETIKAIRNWKYCEDCNAYYLDE